MKRHLALAALCLAVTSAAVAAPKTTLEFPLILTTYDRPNHRVDIDIPTLNKKLNAAGKPGLPEVVVVNKDSRPYYKLLMKRIEAANAVVGSEIDTPIHDGYFYEYPTICYRGNPAAVWGIVVALSGNFDSGDLSYSFFSHGQGLLAARYGKKKIVNSDEFKTARALREYYEGNADEQVETYLNYDQTSDAVLMMSNLGDQGDGTDLYATFIERCD